METVANSGIVVIIVIFFVLYYKYSDILYCRYMRWKYGIVSNSSWGTAPTSVQTSWNELLCGKKLT